MPTRSKCTTSWNWSQPKRVVQRALYAYQLEQNGLVNNLLASIFSVLAPCTTTLRSMHNCFFNSAYQLEYMYEYSSQYGYYYESISIVVQQQYYTHVIGAYLLSRVACTLLSYQSMDTIYYAYGILNVYYSTSRSTTIVCAPCTLESRSQ